MTQIVDPAQGLVFDHRDMLRLAYVSPDCRSRILAQLDGLGWFGKNLLDKLRDMDQEARTVVLVGGIALAHFVTWSRYS